MSLLFHLKGRLQKPPYQNLPASNRATFQNILMDADREILYRQ